MNFVTLIGIILAVAGVYYLVVARNILIGLICLIVGLVMLSGGIVFH